MSQSPNNLAYLLSRMQTPVSREGRIPNSDPGAEPRRENRIDSDKLAKYYLDQYERAMALRRSHAKDWTQVLSITSGIHYYQIDQLGNWIPLAKKNQRDIRARVPIMAPLVTWEHGRLSANRIAFSCVPTTGRGAESFWTAQLAQDVLNHWAEEIQIEGFDDAVNQDLVYYGGTALYADPLDWAHQVHPCHYPFCDLLPIPFDARTWEEMDGVQRCTIVSRDWLEQQDEITKRNFGKVLRPMAKASRAVSTNLGGGYAGFSYGFGVRQTVDGAIARWIWRRPNEANPFGEALFMVDDEIHGYVSGQDQYGNNIALANGRIPLHPIYYDKAPHDWWPTGFAERLISMQLEGNRQMNRELRAAVINRGFIGVNTDAGIKLDDIQDSEDGLFAFKASGLADSRAPIAVTAQPSGAGRDTAAVLNLVQQFARMAANYQSDTIFGGAEGRTEGGPAVGLLDSRAQTGIWPVLQRKARAYKRLGADALDGARRVWPQSKKIRVLGPMQVGKEMMLSRESIPASANITIEVAPMVPNGRMGMYGMLRELGALRDETGQSMIKPGEFRTSLAMLGLAPAGLTLFDKPSQRIAYRIGLLINDTQTPAIPPAGQSAGDMQDMEDHKRAVDMLRDVLLDPSTRVYSPAVLKALRDELDFHNRRLDGIVRSVNNFDDGVAENDKLQLEDYLFNSEQTSGPTGMMAAVGAAG